MTTWTHSPNEVASEWKSMFDEDLISPYGDFNASTDLSKFWDTSLSSVTAVEVSSVSIVSGALKVIATSSSTDCKYTKAIPVVVGESYTIAGTSTAAADSTTIKGGSTSGGNEYFQLLIGTAGLPDTFAEDKQSGSLTFTTTTDTLYFQVHMTNPSDHISIDDISLTGKPTGVLRGLFGSDIDATWNTLYGGVWGLGSLVSWKDIDKHNWEDWN